MTTRRHQPPGGKPARRCTLLAVAALAGAVASIACLGTPALAHGATGAAVTASGPPPPPGPTYAKLVDSNITVDGRPASRILVMPDQGQPLCWLEPRFTGADSWHPGDPQPPYSPTLDAETYYFWVAQETGLLGAVVHHPGAEQAITKLFRDARGHPSYWWWVPAWLDGSKQNGFSCAYDNLLGGLNNGYLNFQPPVTLRDGANVPDPVNVGLLKAAARAAVQLPSITLHTNPDPRAGQTSYVNLPIWVWATYNGPLAQTHTAEIAPPFGAPLAVTVWTSHPALTITTNAGAGQTITYGPCAVHGSPYRPGDSASKPGCGLTFLAPSTSGPYTITATATWQVYWAVGTAAIGGTVFKSPPWPSPTTHDSEQVSVREIQTINNGG